MQNLPPWRLMNQAERRRYWQSQWRLGLPALSVLALLFIMTAPLIVPVPVFPHLGLLGVMVWANLRPGLMPAWLAFLLGLFADLLFGQPLGLDGTLFALAAALVRLLDLQRVDTRLFDWREALIVVSLFELGAWQLMTLAGQPIPLLPLAWQWLTTLVAYPLVVALAAMVQRRALGAMG